MKVKSSIKSWILCCAMGLALLSATGAQEVWERLTDYEKPKNAEEQRAWDLIKACRHQGSEGARRLIAEMQRIPRKYRKNALGALSRIQCQETRDYLLSLALSSSDTYAAIVYLENSGDSSPARKLLNSTNREIQALALRVLLTENTKELSERQNDYGISLDRRAWEVVKQMLASESLDLRQLATQVAARSSPAEVTVAEKAKAIAESMATTLSLKGAEKMTRYDDFVLDYSCLLGEDVLARQAIALGWMKGVTGEMLAVLTPVEPGLARDGMVIARTIAGDLTMRGELHRIVTNSPSSRLRMAALDQALNWRTATEADRVCLEAVAAADPLQGSPGKDYAHFTGDRGFDNKRNPKIYPARILAERSLRALDARKNPPAAGP